MASNHDHGKLGEHPSTGFTMVVFPLYPRVGSMNCCEGLQLSKYHPATTQIIVKYDPNVLYFVCCRAKYRDQREYDTASWDCHVYCGSVERDMA